MSLPSAYAWARRTTVPAGTVNDRLRPLALPDEITPLETTARVLPLLLDVAEVAHRAASDTVDGVTYCGFCDSYCGSAGTCTSGCRGPELRAALDRLYGAGTGGGR